MNVLTFAPSTVYVEDGLALAVVVVRRRPRIIINQTAARAEGIRFRSTLLRQATLVDEGD